MFYKEHPRDSRKTLKGVQKDKYLYKITEDNKKKSKYFLKFVTLLS